MENERPIHGRRYKWRKEAFAVPDTQAADDAQKSHGQKVSGAGGSGDGVARASGAVDYEKAIDERDARITELEAQVAAAAKFTETADELHAQVVELKAQGGSDRIDSQLRLRACET